MDKKQLKFILEEGEGLKIEFKESFDPKTLSKELVAFANSEGGRILLGVSDDKQVKGIKITNKLKSQIQDLARNCDPSIKIGFEKIDNILVINVLEGSNKPYQCSFGFYLREGPNSQKLSRDEILRLVTGSGKIKFDELLNDNFKFPKDFDKDKFNDFLNRCKITNKNIKDTLINLSLAQKKKNKIVLNNASILLFGKNIGRFIRQNFVYCTLFKGKERVDIIDRKEFKEDLLTNYFEALNFLKKHLRLEYIIKGSGPREEKLEIPEEALKEALVNAFIHRDYFETGFGVTVEIFDDRIEITNWGKLLFDRKELGKVSIPRNFILFDLFHRLDMIEKAGSGIVRIRRLAKSQNVKVKFETSEFFRIIFERPVIIEKTTQKTTQKILELIKQNPSVTRKELADIIGITEDGVKFNINKLKKKRILKRIGPDKGGYWKIKDERI